LWAFLSKRKHNRILSRQKTEIENKTGQLKEQAAQIARLSSQMNPHFLFNALNSLQKFVLNKNEEETLEYISQLSALMRGTLNNSTQEHITLQDEVEYLQRYLQFEKTLLGNEFSFEIDTAGLTASDISIAPMLVQPLVENAIKHGLSAKPGEKKVSIRFERENDSLKITVRDNGVGRKLAAATGHRSRGLDILNSRIISEYEIQMIPVPTQAVTVIDHEEPTGTEIILRVPLIENF
jgi:LytS/YehU family sensor histidine kinase